MRKQIFVVVCAAALALGGYVCGKHTTVAYAGSQNYAAAPSQENMDHTYAPVTGSVPKSYGKLVTAISDQIGTGLVFESNDGVIRFVAMTGMKEGELARYDQTPVHGGIPKSYGHLVAAVTNPKGTGLVFEDSQGIIRFVTITGKEEGELVRN